MRCPVWYAFAFDAEPEELEGLCEHFDCDVCVAALAEAPWMFGWGEPEEEDEWERE